ncbi:MAG: hypothetical protein BWX86_02340 [Verrucomicrobia bacterium ADurb.Bin122]|nr:MAG: hypothetical protein BWX86_02340 [Verrucomicrobia bacterium ADurb.Bin122]
MTISVNMLGSRSRSDFHQRRRNGRPHQKNTGAVNTHWSHAEAGDGTRCASAGTMPPIASRNTGTLSASATHSRGRR